MSYCHLHNHIHSTRVKLKTWRAKTCAISHFNVWATIRASIIFFFLTVPSRGSCNMSFVPLLCVENRISEKCRLTYQPRCVLLSTFIIIIYGVLIFNTVWESCCFVSVPEHLLYSVIIWSQLFEIFSFIAEKNTILSQETVKQVLFMIYCIHLLYLLYKKYVREGKFIYTAHSMHKGNSTCFT